MKKIKLTQGKFALVDDEDFEWLDHWKWTYDATVGYAYRRQHLPSTRKVQKCKKIYMHRLINSTLDGWHTDHINQNKLDNRRSNLRTVTRSQNLINRGAPINNTSGYKGVSWAKRDKIWLATLHVGGTCRLKTGFKNLEDAVRARKEAEKVHHAI